jgi:hypothetical protein
MGCSNSRVRNMFIVVDHHGQSFSAYSTQSRRSICLCASSTVERYVVERLRSCLSTNAVFIILIPSFHFTL